MKWTKIELLQAIQTGDAGIRNYFDTFGFVVIKGMVDKPDFRKLFAEYDRQYALRGNKQTLKKILMNEAVPSGPSPSEFRALWQAIRRMDYVRLIKKYGFGLIWKVLGRKEGMRFLPNFVDSSPLFMEHFFSEEMTGIYRYFAGEKFLYLGSDGSHFITTSFPWHRDWYTKMPIMKFNFYFNPLPFFGGKFMVVPGSNFPQDAYAGFLQKSMAWPMQNKLPGGMSENTFLPPTINPRRSVISSLAGRIKTFFGGHALQDIPHISVKLSKGDIVIFDQRLIHCVQANFPPFSRRLLTILLSKNAYEFSNEHYLLQSGNDRAGLMREVVDLVISERNHIGCPAYGDAIYQHAFSKSDHFISIEKTPADTPQYNTGSFALENGARFTSTLDVDQYAAIGTHYRHSIGQNQKNAGDTLAQHYSYGDVHLGINAQNIRKISNT